MSTHTARARLIEVVPEELGRASASNSPDAEWISSPVVRVRRIKPASPLGEASGANPVGQSRKADRPAPGAGLPVDEEDMANENAAPNAVVRDIPIDWEALEDAFENNAPEVHSYLHLVTGDVLRVVDGVADPQMHARIAADQNYLRIDPVSSREQYRWMERYIPMVEDQELAGKLTQAIDGKGAFRRFKDVLMAYGPERERWFTFRSERLRIFMEAWLSAHALNPVARPLWVAEAAPRAEPSEPGGPGGPGGPGAQAAGQVVGAGSPPREEPREIRRGKSAESLRKNLREIADALGPRDLDTLTAFAEFLNARRAARSFGGASAVNLAAHAGDFSGDEDTPTSQEIVGSTARSETG
ncbi:MAG: UPF0158 family protein [Polyangiaceae bacterium]